MGYEVEEIYILEWENRPGAQVKARSISSGELLQWSAKQAMLREAAEAEGGNSRDVAFRHMAELLTEVVESWTFERRGVPVPITEDGCLMLGHKLLLAVYKAYMDESAEVDEGSDLGKDSNSGDSYPEELQAMEVLSESPSN